MLPLLRGPVYIRTALSIPQAEESNPIPGAPWCCGFVGYYPVCPTFCEDFLAMEQRLHNVDWENSSLFISASSILSPTPPSPRTRVS